MNRIFFCSCFVISLVLFSEQGFSQNTTLQSPDGKLKLNITAGKKTAALLNYQLCFLKDVVVQNGTVAFDSNDSTGQYVCAGTQRSKANTTWQTVYGERKNIPDKYNQLILHFKKDGDTALQLTIVLRLYNEGFAYHYEVQHKGHAIVLNKETSSFTFPTNATAWVSTTAQGLLKQKKINDIKEEVERPLTMQLQDGVFVALGEAALDDFTRMKFTGDGNNGIITKLYGETKKFNFLKSPWRYIMVAPSPAALLQNNYFVLNLNEPNRIANTSWIQPGNVLREATLTTKGAFDCINFAATHNIKYICFDAGWYGKEDSDTSDATRVSIDPARSKGTLDLKKVIQYGQTKKVGVILYVNRRALERQLDTLLPLYQSWGVKGLKFGFVQVGAQKWTGWLHEAIRKAAKYHMVVDVHDEYRPTGYTRTYPNLLTQEGIRGDEESPFLENAITTMFTRMIAGPADQTNCYFTARVDKMGSHVAQIAKAVCLYSPLQFLYWYDRPKTDSLPYKEGEIQEVPDLAWYNALPTVWDDTKVLEGDMQAYATVARKKNNSWFVGSLNGTEPRKVTLPLLFLDKNKKYVAKIYTDDPRLPSATHVKISSRKVDAQTVLQFEVGSRNGIAIQIIPQ